MAQSKDSSGDDSAMQFKAIPAGRASRFSRMARLASGVAGGMLAEGARQLREGRLPKARDMLLTPSNARRVANQLADMRGAAMKLGQILSMDTGDLLPRELSEILSRLRATASAMPERQLSSVMSEAYGEDWESLFEKFDRRPIAAASIGQVHKTRAPDGREIVLKVQYPGVVQSIDSDVDNIATVLRISGLLPDNVDIQPLLDDAKIRLREEADYLKEAEFLQAFGEVLANDERFILPEVLPELTRCNVLAMTYTSGSPIESIADLPQAERDRVMSALIELMLTELFELKMVQTDPNFANYRYRHDTGEIVLLDFGATRRFKATFVRNYKKLAAAAVAEDRSRVALAAERLGYAMGDEDSDYRAIILELFLLALEPLREDRLYDFAASDIPARMSDLADEVKQYRDFWQAPPTDAVYFHRKLGGMFMLANRVRARVNVHRLISAWL